MRSNPVAGIVMLMLMPLLANAQSTGTDTTGRRTQPQVPEFKNAYSIAKELTAVYQPTDTLGIIRALASLAWYAGVKNPEDLPNKISASEYSVLAARVNALLNNITNPDLIFLWTPDDFERKYTATGTARNSLLFALRQVWAVDGRARSNTQHMQTMETTLNTLKHEIDTTLKEFYRKIDVLATLERDLTSLTDSQRVQQNRHFIMGTQTDTTNLSRKLNSLYNRFTEDSTTYRSLESTAKDLAQQQADARNAVRKLLKKDVYTDLKTRHFSHKFTGATFSSDNMERLQKEVNNLSQNSIKYDQYIINSEQTGLTPLSFKMPSQADMIEALAIYLAKRVKQETVLWFFETLRRNAEVNQFIRDGFPETVKLLEGGALYETPNMGSAWRYALSKDFISFPQHAFESKWLRNYIPESGQNILDDLQTGVTIARLLQQQYSYNDIVRYLYMEMSSLPPGQPSMSKHVVDLLYGLQHELVVEDTAKRTRNLSFEDFDRMDDSSFVVMLELINLRYYKCVAGLTGWKTGEKELTARDIQQLKTWVGKLQFTIKQIHNAREELNKAINDLNRKADAGNFSFTHYSVWKFFEELMKNALPDESLTGPGVSLYRTSLQYLAQAQEIYELLEKKNYSGAIGSTFNILDKLMESATGEAASTRLLTSAVTVNKDELPKRLKEAGGVYKVGLDSALARQGLDSLIALIDAFKNDSGLHFLKDGKVLVDSIPRLGMLKDTLFANANALKTHIYSTVMNAYVFTGNAAKSVETFSRSLMYQYRQEYYDIRQAALRIAGFLNDISLAGDSKQLARVIESYAMPPGSYKRKRNVWYSLDLNAFVGAYAGAEFPVKTFNQEATNIDNGGVYGLSAPIGLSWSRTVGRNIDEKTISKTGNIKNKKSGLFVPSGHTFTFTLSVIDIGAVVSYRFNHTESVRPQEFKWDQLISPGIHVGWGIPRTPLIISAGAVFTPQLRRVEDVVNEQNQEVITDRQFNTFRLYGGLFFDIPLFNLWERKSITRR